MKQKAILFDFDDTLFDHRSSMLTGLMALQKMYDCFAVQTLFEFERVHLRLLNDVHLNSIFNGKLTLEEARALRFKRAFMYYGIDADDKLSYEAAEIYRTNYVSVNRLVPGAVKLLNILKPSYKICVVTNNFLDEQLRKLRTGKIEHLIDEMITSEEVKSTKPEPLIFQTILNRLQVTPDDTIMIGDSWYSDIIGASNLGMKCIWVNVYNETCPDPAIAAEVKSLEDTELILKLIKLLFLRKT